MSNNRPTIGFVGWEDGWIAFFPYEVKRDES